MTLQDLLKDLPGLRYTQAKDEFESSESRKAYERLYGPGPMKTSVIRAELEALVQKAKRR